MKLTVPLPLPDAPPVTVSQGTLAAAVHAHEAADAFTATDPVPPCLRTSRLFADSVNVHGGGGGGGAACDTVNVWPAMVSVPLRAAPVFAATVNATLPAPVPDAPLVTDSQGAFDPAVHAHDPADGVTATDPVPPVSATFCVVGAIVNVHGGGGAAACETVNVWPAIVIVPLRAAPVLAAAVKATVPFPVPDAPLVSVSQGALAVALHVHVLVEAVTATEPEPPVSAMF